MRTSRAMSEAVQDDGRRWVEEVTRDAVRHFAWGVGDDNPLWLDPEYAAGSRWRELLAPPCFPYAVHETSVAPGYLGRRRRYRSAEWVWLDAIRLGAVLTPRIRLEDCDTTGEVVRQRGRVEFGEPGSPRVWARVLCERPPETETLVSTSAGRYSGEELAEIETSVLGETRRGAEPRWFEETEEGAVLPPRTKGPLSIMDLVAWCAGALGVPPAEAPRCEGGLVDEVATGPQLVSWCAHLLSDWAGDDAFLHRLAVEIDALPGLGTTTSIRGVVERRRETGPIRAVDVALEAVDRDERPLAKGNAVVLLPSRATGPVPLPLAREIDTP